MEGQRLDLERRWRLLSGRIGGASDCNGLMFIALFSSRNPARPSRVPFKVPTSQLDSNYCIQKRFGQADFESWRYTRRASLPLLSGGSHLQRSCHLHKLSRAAGQGSSSDGECGVRSRSSRYARLTWGVSKAWRFVSAVLVAARVVKAVALRRLLRA